MECRVTNQRALLPLTSFIACREEGALNAILAQRTNAGASGLLLKCAGNNGTQGKNEAQKDEDMTKSLRTCLATRVKAYRKLRHIILRGFLPVSRRAAWKSGIAQR